MILQADARYIPLKNKSVQMVCTSPPFWGLRDYGVNGQLGLEKTPEEYVANLVAVFREVWRVLRGDGTCWVNLGDSYVSNASSQVPQTKSHVGSGFAGPNRAGMTGLKPKDLVGIPWRVAFALQADGWWLRRDIIWSKPNPMPESVTDRPTTAHEYLFLLAKSERYYYDAGAVQEPCESGPSDVRKMLESLPRIGGKHKILDDPLSKASATTNIGRKRSVGGKACLSPRNDGERWNENDGRGFTPISLGRNRRSVWTIATEPYPEAHFATFPRKLVEPCILAGTSARGCCATCGAPWERMVERTGHINKREPAHAPYSEPTKTDSTGWAPRTRTTNQWNPICACGGDPVPCIVLDPFAGSGTTVAVAESLGRRGIGIELKAEYLALSQRRMAEVTMGLPLLPSSGPARGPAPPGTSSG